MPSFRTVVACCCLLALTAPLHAQSSYRKVDNRDCCITDMPFPTSSGFSASYVLPADTTAPAWEELSAAELGAWGRFGHWENESGADFELLGLWDTTFLSFTGPEDELYPLTMARLRFRWTQRFEANYGFEADVSPGLYSSFESFEGADLSIPFSARWIKPFTPDFSVFIGANVYPTFDHVVDPNIGLRYAYRDQAILDVAFPESKIVLSPGPRFRFTAGARVALWPEYNMGDDPRERIRTEEIRFYGSLDVGITDATLLSFIGGSVLERQIAFESASESVDIEDAVYGGIALSRML